MNIFQKLLQTVGNYADKPFLIDSITDRIFSFQKFHLLACNLAKYLHKRGIRRSDRIAIVLNNSSEFVLLYFACLYLGAVVVPVNPQLHKREIEFIIEKSGAKMIIFSPSTKGLITKKLFEQNVFNSLCLLPKADQDDPIGYQDALMVSDITIQDDSSWKPFDNVTPDDLFSITFTSGTTGLPKGVSHKINSQLQNAILFDEELGFESNNCFYHIFSMSYMAGILNTLLCPFLAGASVVITRAFDAKLAINFWDIPIKYGVDTLWLAPTILSSLMRLDRTRYGTEYCRKHIKTICVGTAPLPIKLKQDFEEKYGVELFESYGLSETLFVTTNSKKIKYLPGSVGKALPGITVKIIDEEGSEVSYGKDGEIWIRTPFIMAGYLDYQTSLPEISESGEWFPSGDIGHINTDGYLFITDRKKDIIIRGGINISPRSIEDVIMTHESIAQVAVVGLPHEFYGEEVVAVVKLKAGYSLETVLPALNNLCKKNLSAFAVPTKFVALDEFPSSTTGKVQKAKLREFIAIKLGIQKG